LALKGHIVGFAKVSLSVEACCDVAQRLGATSFTFNVNSSQMPVDPDCRFFGDLEPRRTWSNCASCRSFAANQTATTLPSTQAHA